MEGWVLPITVFMVWSYNGTDICTDDANPKDNEIWLGTGSSVEFESPNYPDPYYFNDTAEWVFCALDPDDRISISCQDFDVGLQFLFCLDDSLFISSAPYPYFFCGANGPEDVVTTERGTTVSLLALGLSDYRGFACNATAVTPEWNNIS